MNHFYQQISGFFDFENFYTEIVNWSPTTAHFIEVGTWKGRSAAYLIVEAINSGKNIKIDCVDTWLGSNEETHIQDLHVKEGTLFEHFISNMQPVAGKFTPIRTTSLEAAAQYNDNSLDFVFIDASHYYVDVVADIQAWKPKIKQGGILAGHDYVTCGDVKRAVTDLLPGFEFKAPNSWMIKL
jgi:cephalosporin hydroxylase